MAQFRIPAGTVPPHERASQFLWGSVLALLGITAFGIISGLHGNDLLNKIAVGLATAIVIFAVGAAYYFGARMGLERAQRNSVFVLTDRELIRKREGWPNIQIGLLEIKALCDRPHYLIVEGPEPLSRITVPKRVENFELLRAELLKYSSVVKPPARSSLYWIPTLISFACWPLVTWSHDIHVVLGAGIMLLALSGWLCLGFDKKLAHVPKRALIRAWLVVSWFIALWIVYSRVARL